MSGRRPLGEMLGELASGTLESLAAAPGLRVDSIVLTLPVEWQVRWSGDEVSVLGDLPRLLTRTDFDLRPGRVEVVWEARERS